MPRALVLLAALLLAGCALAPAAGTQEVTVEVVNAPGAECRGEDLQGRKYQWTNTPATAALPWLGGPINLACEKPGFKKLALILTRSAPTGGTPRETFFFFPPAAAAVGLLEGASGARYAYPTPLRLVMEPEDSAPEAERKKYEELRKQYEREVLGR
ncbi:MAG: hypothetical protein HY618_06570 [Candidatus Tectomicrobia bacterium]|uniref:PEGA domain-containing protein n=1 Tax=Tectimicrobiota bacterium TaxID=2528274 RepID=A0A932ZXP0_UNCTE|nr:hypothetical protein [Candidatus Tectomicrobia bacterium]